MYLLLILGSWVLGIASMGYALEQHALFKACVDLASWIWLLTVLLVVATQLKLQFSQTFTFKVLSCGLVSLSLFLLGQFYANWQLDDRLEQRIMEAGETTALIYVHKLDQRSNAQEKNRLKQQVRWASQTKNKSTNQNPNVLLYFKQDADQTALQLGQYYQVTGKIKPAHSYAVAHVFDQEKWLLQQNIMGSMQVKQIQPISEQALIADGYEDFIRSNSDVIASLQLSAERLRLHFRHLIQKQPLENKGLLLALLTGDEALLAEETQAQFKRLGISHLLAISGPHVLIFAVMFCFVLNLIISTFKPTLFLKIPRPYFLVLPFVFCVIAYTAFVGFEIPALRTCLTVCLISFVLLLKQQLHALKLLLLSASILLLIDPFSILSAAFWLSYGACFILIRVYQTMLHQSPQMNADIVSSRWSKGSKLVRVLVESQWKVFIALFPLVALIFGQVSWISPIVNLIAIPIIGAVIVPLAVIGAVFSTLIEPLGLLFFHLADFSASFLLWVLGGLDQLFHPKLSWLSLSPLMIASLAIGTIILFLPKGTVPKLWAVLCFLPLILPSKQHTDFSLTILDVGQGQAVVLNTPEHKMMIDTGGSFDETQFSVANSIVIPYLMGEGISQLDHVLLTHLDQDHAGAFEKLNQSIKINQVSSNQHDERFEQSNFDYCHAGQGWQFKEMKIQVLAPAENSLSMVPYAQNELSCIVYIQVPKSKGFQHFLLMGDTGWEAEYRLLQTYPNLKVDVLVLGHHGSQHSSSFGFLKHYQPKLAIASAGVNNRYGHPHPITQARLKALSIPFESTIQQGSISFELQQNGEMREKHHRQTRMWLMR